MQFNSYVHNENSRKRTFIQKFNEDYFRSMHYFNDITL